VIIIIIIIMIILAFLFLTPGIFTTWGIKNIIIIINRFLEVSQGRNFRGAGNSMAENVILHVCVTVALMPYHGPPRHYDLSGHM